MTHPLSSIKELTTDTLTFGLTLPGRIAARAYGVARGAVTVGVRVVGEARRAPVSGSEQATTRQPTPVNVVEELGLDPAPADEPVRPEALTSIDAQADPTQVEATPADVAERLSRND